MTLLDRRPAETVRERAVPVLETERLVLRAPRLEDAEALALLLGDRRIAENTANILALDLILRSGRRPRLEG